MDGYSEAAALKIFIRSIIPSLLQIYLSQHSMIVGPLHKLRL